MPRFMTRLHQAWLDLFLSMFEKGMTAWPDVPEPDELRTLTGDEKVTVMSYADYLFSWYAGSVAADISFYQERQGTCFGSFYMKDALAMGNPTVLAPTSPLIG